MISGLLMKLGCISTGKVVAEGLGTGPDAVAWVEGTSKPIRAMGSMSSILRLGMRRDTSLQRLRFSEGIIRRKMEAYRRSCAMSV